MKGKLQYVILAIISISFILLVMIGYGIWMYPKDPQVRGTFGDMYGTVNTLFSGLALAGIIITIYMQGNELKLQREELEMTRKELEGQKVQLEHQNTNMQQQNFESTFFSMLDLLNDIVNSMEDLKMRPGGNIITHRGRKVIAMHYDVFRQIYQNKSKEIGQASDMTRIDIIYNIFYNQHKEYYGHYFRTLYNIIKFVNFSNIEGKKLYTNLARAQLSDHELAMLFYNCLSNHGLKKFKPLVEEYSLLKNLPQELLLVRDHKQLYASKAFGEDSQT